MGQTFSLQQSYVMASLSRHLRRPLSAPTPLLGLSDRRERLQYTEPKSPEAVFAFAGILQLGKAVSVPSWVVFSLSDFY